MKPPFLRALVMTIALIAACDSRGEELTAPALAKGAGPQPKPEIAWSNDGIWVMNRDGSNQARVTPRGYWLGNPSWSPVPGAGPSYEIAYFDITNSRIARVRVTLQNGVPRGDTPQVLADNAAYPVWSPLGDEIAFVSPDPVDGSAGIWVMKADGTGKSLIYSPSGQAVVTRPTWDRAGLRIAFVEDDDETALYPNRRILVVGRTEPGAPWSTSASVRYEAGGASGPFPNGFGTLDWARTKDVIAVSGGGFVHTIDSLGTLNTIVAGQRPSWSPDDTQIVYYTSGGGTTKVASITLGTGQSTTLATKVTCCRPDWRR